MNKLFLFIISIFLFTTCRDSGKAKNIAAREKTDQIYQYSVFTALANKIYDGSIAVSYLKEKGDLGLGTYNGLNGEMIVLDGIFYQLLPDGTILQANDEALVPFSVVTFFDNDYSFEITDSVNYDKMKAYIVDKLPSENTGFSFKIKGAFNWIKCGGAEQQIKPYSKTLSKALANRPIFEAENINGTMVGFWVPEYVGEINVLGFHLHFISEDKTIAGHVIDFKALDLSIMIDQCSGFEIELPETKDFLKSELDLSEGYK